MDSIEHGILQSMYKVVLAERDYERAMNEILRKKIEELEKRISELEK